MTQFAPLLVNHSQKGTSTSTRYKRLWINVEEGLTAVWSLSRTLE